MSSESPTRQRLHLQGSFSSPEEKDMFLSRFEAARQLLVPGVTRNATISVLNALLDRVLQQTESVPVTRSGTSSSGREMMLDSAGIYTGDEDPSDQDLFVVERNAFKRLCSGLVQHCGCLTSPSWTLASFKKKTCSQSTICLPKVLVPEFCPVIILPIRIYVDKLYQQIISDAVEESMKAVVDRVKANPDCITSGEWFIADARHNSTSNAYHTTVPCLAGRQDHRVAQTREVVCTKMVLPQVIARGLNITEVAHDYQATIKKYIEELGMMNSYDTWHARSTKVQLCCCMKNCAGNPDILRAMIMNISKHFQGDHHSCYSESPCQQPGYIPKRKPLTMPAAIRAYEDALKKKLIYRMAESFRLGRDTCMVGVAIEALELEMEREADFLRCSKLNVYAEFNKMVQAIARLGPRQSQMRFTQGTSEEYRFYANLANLLRQVINNPDAIRQREDLQQVYQWFHHNKPLVTQTIKPSQRKPTIAFSDRRPQTTPLHISSLHEVESLSDIAEEQGDFRDVIAVSSQGSWAGSHSRRLNSVTFGSILDKAVGIAADMTLQREEILEFHRAVKNTLVRPATVPMAITSTQASVPVANADLEHGHGTQIAASSSSEGNTLSCNKTNSEHRDSTFQGGATDGPHPTSQGGATDGPHPTSQGGATDGPHPTSQGGATDGPHPTSQGGATDGPHPTSQGGATDGPHPTQLGVCPAMRVGSEPRPLTREGIR
eukprot:Em0022g49a